MADSITTSTNPSREFLEELQGQLHHVDGLLSALTQLTTLTPLDERANVADAADAVLLAVRTTVTGLHEHLEATILGAATKGQNHG